MSRIGRIPVEVPAGVTVEVKEGAIAAKGPAGALQYRVPEPITVHLDGKKVALSCPDDSRRSKSLHGLSRTLVRNLLEGVSKGYRKDLVIEGVGYKAELKGKVLVLALGFSHPVRYEVPEGIKIAVEGANTITVTGADKQLVGDVAARLRGFAPAEPYQGKGVRYKDERIRRKVGKTVS